jgi:hypothetical protein
VQSQRQRARPGQLRQVRFLVDDVTKLDKHDLGGALDQFLGAADREPPDRR